MDFPMFHLDWLNDRFLIAAVAIIHVMINHGLAVGFIPYITWLEFKGVQRAGREQIADWEWDRLIHNKMKVGFIITTTIGAMTGVGIWFTVALVSPSSIGSLIRVFYWAWFTEWIVFVTEVVLISIYYLSWESANKSLRSKLKHIRFGAFLSIASWITMVIIVSILSFMMDPGNWNTHKSLFNGFTNPIYIPQLFFRTPVAMLMGGVFGMLLTTLFTKKRSTLRIQVVRLGGKWILSWTPIALAGALYYWNAMPEAMKANMSTAVGSMDFAEYYDILKYFIVGATILSVLLAIWAIWKPQKVNVTLVIVPCLLIFGFLGIFERVREFVRKPYVIGGYMYSNLLREEDYALYKKDGILKHATYTSVQEITPENKIEAGKNVFMLTCSRCHTSNGINSIVDVFEKMYGRGKPLDEESMSAYIPNMHQGRTFMPPFPGNKKELEAIVAYIKQLQGTRESLQGAQVEGIKVNPLQNMEQAVKAYGDSVLVSKK
ncbi:cytochrome c [Sphingobacterium sp. HMA12]|uniref:c-type cytochrome n=1 Tax=Sphingobacterium sp. HMA12 TaxID=2050894 RepID=UPI000CE9CE07|nr:cytochrome c [Sphingobacterium sp. HMA12]